MSLPHTAPQNKTTTKIKQKTIQLCQKISFPSDFLPDLLTHCETMVWESEMVKSDRSHMWIPLCQFLFNFKINHSKWKKFPSVVFVVFFLVSKITSRWLNGGRFGNADWRKIVVRLKKCNNGIKNIEKINKLWTEIEEKCSFFTNHYSKFFKYWVLNKIQSIRTTPTITINFKYSAPFNFDDKSNIKMLLKEDEMRTKYSYMNIFTWQYKSGMLRFSRQPTMASIWKEHPRLWPFATFINISLLWFDFLIPFFRTCFVHVMKNFRLPSPQIRAKVE